MKHSAESSRLDVVLDRMDLNAATSAAIDEFMKSYGPNTSWDAGESRQWVATAVVAASLLSVAWIVGAAEWVFTFRVRMNYEGPDPK